ncbi:TetR family transcriptional regulator [Nocardioides sp. zg-579]|uniref:TetR family transcriptional regulator n=1 Tax=Nocardioides marmotae TaxID=2663857 RepID=A0A6I3J4A8_9ACTN|nr:TetR/AcrR family transcriptional regulator [Nocardioides marmotae]MCR6030133.1 TetR family transcriptional regulator [Gordonia jinghuaiqii]MTB93764.1 TetR family transcriptional regulator [Nocardioides marmotae]QKE00101.1 TetR family transcriptional regulator [Nocardioides marmotae]
MPRISAATVAEHRAQQRRALLDAARALLAQSASAPSMGAVASRAGLARTSVYQYFASVEELMAAVVADVFPDWAAHVLDRVAAAPTPGQRVWAYVEANLELFASSEQAVAGALARVVEPHVLRGPMEDFHARLQVPLLAALEDFGEPEPSAMAEHVDSLIHQASRDLGSLEPAERAAARARALARLRRLLGGYLRLDEDE